MKTTAQRIILWFRISNPQFVTKLQNGKYTRIKEAKPSKSIPRKSKQLLDRKNVIDYNIRMIIQNIIHQVVSVLLQDFMATPKYTK